MAVIKKKNVSSLVILGFLQRSAPEVTQAALLRKRGKVRQITQKKSRSLRNTFPLKGFPVRLFFIFFQSNRAMLFQN